MTRDQIKSKLVQLWERIDLLVYLIVAGFVGAALAYGAANRSFQSEREQLAIERAQLVQRIVAVRQEETNRCVAEEKAIRDDYRERANEWQDRLKSLAIQVENANRNADNCHAQVAKAAKQVDKAAANAAVAAKKSTEAADAATAEHVQQTLIRKYEAKKQ